MHYNEALWVDFVRGLVKDELALEMHAHLKSGCRRCNAVHSSLVAVEDTFSVDRARSVPEEILASARALFQKRRSSWGELPRAIAALVSDSLLQPSWAGSRSSADASRHFCFASGIYHVDLQLERQSLPPAQVVTGQLATTDPQSEVSGVTVVVLDEEKEVGQQLTNEFGEFQFDLPAQKKLRVLLLVDQGTRAVEIDLQNVAGKR